jgi:hypothetical protein
MRVAQHLTVDDGRVAEVQDYLPGRRRPRVPAPADGPPARPFPAAATVQGGATPCGGPRGPLPRVARQANGAAHQKAGSWYGRWLVGDRRVNRRLGPVREPGTREGLTRSQGERELRRRMEQDQASAATTVSRLTVAEAGKRYVHHLTPFPAFDRAEDRHPRRPHGWAPAEPGPSCRGMGWRVAWVLNLHRGIP